jgi:hypothetical protein
MTTSAISSLLPGPVPVARKKRVLLVDQSTASRDLRAETMRKLGMEVDCAIDISEARLWWRADLYHLVLLNVENEMGIRDRFCEDIGSAVPPQQFAFLVGKPGYVANVPNAGADSTNGPVVKENVEPSISASEDTPLRWGIMEASRQISAVRSVAAARTKAMRDRPLPPRDLEVRDPRRVSRLQAELASEFSITPKI